jgi:hypothetical protein
MKVELEYNIISSYKRLSYKEWYALAEFVDNSTQAYFDNKVLLDDIYAEEGTKLRVLIDYSSSHDKITITDNSIGMNKLELSRALKIGMPPKNFTGRSKYGLGLKTAACWLGDVWKITTKKLGETEGYSITFDVDKVAEGENNLKEIPFKADKKEHYTIIEISKLNRKFHTRTLGKIRDFLRSIYRYDFSNYGLMLYFQNSLLHWEDLTKKLYVQETGKPYKKTFEFLVNEKVVKGWVGVLAKGSRASAGFSIIQANRVIQGWPGSYKPESVFGEQEDGSNNLINQRVVGELFLDGFEVSHTKDQIIWLGDEEELIDKELGKRCKEAMALATTLRFRKEEKSTNYEINEEQAIAIFEKEVKSPQFSDFLNTVTPPPDKVLRAAYEKVKDVAIKSNLPRINVKIGHSKSKIEVLVYFTNNSEFEPYVLMEATSEENKVIVIINELHQFLREMKTHESILNFIRQCVYDAVAEWKAIQLLGEIQPNTIKYIKDGLLKLPYEIEKSFNHIPKTKKK